MELWIRSQDKLKLYKMNTIETDSEIESCKETGRYIIYINDDYFATYETKKRALEVLDEIQNKLMKKDKDNTELTYARVEMANNEEKIIILKQCDLLYEMPKE